LLIKGGIPIVNFSFFLSGFLQVDGDITPSPRLRNLQVYSKTPAFISSFEFLSRQQMKTVVAIVRRIFIRLVSSAKSGLKKCFALLLVVASRYFAYSINR
jgi:hypothetical protein